MLTYTICFIRRGSQLLLLNRAMPPLMGLWNGVGGKIDPGETPEASVLREVEEETTLRLPGARLAGTVTWEVHAGNYGDVGRRGGMYAFVAELPPDLSLPTPVGTAEGILDWKELDWALDPANLGVVSNIQRFLPPMLNDPTLYEHRLVYRDGNLVSYEAVPLPVRTAPY